MSIIGISPSDIVGGVRAAKKAVYALSTENGSQVQYQAFKQSHHHLHVAVKAISEACSSLDVTSSTELEQSLKHILEKHEQQGRHIAKYEESLGESSQLKRKRGIRRKLQWAFQEDEELRDSDARSRLAVDAAILQTLQVQNEVDQRDHTAIRNHVSCTTESAVTRMQENLDHLANHTSHLADEILTENKQQMQRLASLLCSMNKAQEHTIAKLLHTTLTNSATFPAGSTRTYQYRGRRKRMAKKKSQGNHSQSCLSRSSLPGSFPVGDRRFSVPDTSVTCTSVFSLQADDTGHMLNVKRLFWALLFTVFYAHPQSQKLAGRLWMRVQADPVLAILCLLCAALVQQCLPRLAKHISLLSDSSIVFEDVFGIEILVPYQRCEQFEFFHGFLEFYFRQKPGLQRVMKKQYRLLLGNSRGQKVDRSTWTETVKPKSRLTMAMLLISAQSQCAKCFGDLEICKEDHVHKCFACDQEYGVELLTASHQESTLINAVDNQISETEQQNLLSNHSAGSNEAQASAKNRISSGDSEPALGVPTQQITANDNAYTKSNSSKIGTLPEPMSTTQQKARSVHELEVKLFKNMMIRIVSLANSLKSLLPLARESSDNASSTIEKATETLSKESYEGIETDRLVTSDAELRYAIQYPVNDDTAVEVEPTRHVDYLNYDWNEMELILSWRYVRDRRKLINNAVRLENAAWRFWAQKRASLATTTAESLNWLKDDDVAWLYGPLQSESPGLIEDSIGRTLLARDPLPRPYKKPILKQKSHSSRLLEILQSQHSLLQRAVDILKLQQNTVFDRSCESSPSLALAPPTPSVPKHVFFNEEVQQVQTGIEEGETWTTQQLLSAHHY